MSRSLSLSKDNPVAATGKPTRRRWPWLTLDLHQPAHRRRLMLFLTVAGVVALAALFAAFKVYEHTESPQFCGTTCHPMVPLMARYQRSPHARVPCVDCHVGAGVKSYLESKITGAGELLRLATNTYSRPIKSPVHNLRPARETCEVCHTPTSIEEDTVKTIVHYDTDEANTRVQSTLILKMGGLDETTGLARGIHWHISTPVYYIAADEQRQVMLWIGVSQPDGTMKEFFSRDLFNMARTSFVEQARAEGKVRLMDCIDCHNRTAHDIPPAALALDQAMSAGLISPQLPSIKARAVEALSAPYATREEAFGALDRLADEYRANENVSAGDIERARSELKRIYANTNFPDMNLTWATNPNNERHNLFPGCFRCHDDKHVRVDATGNEAQTVSAQCNLCHTVPIVARGQERLVEAPVIVGVIPVTHTSFRWTTEHRSVTDQEKVECYGCHGQLFCDNAACHGVSHPSDMLYSHATEYRKRGGQVCYTCHQDVLCSRCHPAGIISRP